MEAWEKAKTTSSIIAAVFLPVVLLYVGNTYSTAIKERELQGRFVELAVDILKQAPTDDTRNLRDWATQVISLYSGVELSPNTRKDLIERTPLPSNLSPSQRYEGSKALGNTEPGDGARFIGRGYIVLTGRSNYTRVSKDIGVDLVAEPDRAADPDIAAKVFVAFVLTRQDKLISALEANDDRTARRLLVGGTSGMEQITAKKNIYLDALKGAGGDNQKLQISATSNPEWLTVHIPVLLAAMKDAGIDNDLLRAYLLATADVETQQGKHMVELDK